MSETIEREPSVTVSLSQKVNLGNYESADVFISVSGVTVDMPETVMDELLEQGQVVYRKIAARLKEKVSKIKGATRGAA